MRRRRAQPAAGGAGLAAVDGPGGLCARAVAHARGAGRWRRPGHRGRGRGPGRQRRGLLPRGAAASAGPDRHPACAGDAMGTVFVRDASAWRPDFLAWDYIGAPWPEQAGGLQVGNGGFSLRSQRLLKAGLDPLIVQEHPEDVMLCRTYRAALEARHGLRFRAGRTGPAIRFRERWPARGDFWFPWAVQPAAAAGRDHAAVVAGATARRLLPQPRRTSAGAGAAGPAHAARRAAARRAPAMLPAAPTPTPGCWGWRRGCCAWWPEARPADQAVRQPAPTAGVPLHLWPGRRPLHRFLSSGHGPDSNRRQTNEIPGATQQRDAGVGATAARPAHGHGGRSATTPACWRPGR